MTQASAAVNTIVISTPAPTLPETAPMYARAAATTQSRIPRLGGRSCSPPRSVTSTSKEGENQYAETWAPSTPMITVTAIRVRSRLRSLAHFFLRKRTSGTRNGTRTRNARRRGGISGADWNVMMALTVLLRPLRRQPLDHS